MTTCPVDAALGRFLHDQDAFDRAWHHAAASVDRDEVRTEIAEDILNDLDGFNDFCIDHDDTPALQAYGALIAAGFNFNPLSVEGKRLAELKKQADRLVNAYITARFEDAFESAVQRELR